MNVGDCGEQQNIYLVGEGWERKTCSPFSSILNYLFSQNMAAACEELYGKTSDGKDVHRFTLKNRNGLELQIITYGATVVSLKCPDRSVVHVF